MSFYPNEELLYILGRISGTVAKALAMCNDSSSGFQQEEIMLTLAKALFFLQGLVHISRSTTKWKGHTGWSLSDGTSERHVYALRLWLDVLEWI